MEEQGSIHPVVSWNLGEALVQVLMTQCEALGGGGTVWVTAQSPSHLPESPSAHRWDVSCRSREETDPSSRVQSTVEPVANRKRSRDGCCLWMYNIFGVHFSDFIQIQKKHNAIFFLSHSIIDAILRGTFLDGDMYVICWLRMFGEKPRQCQAVLS